MDPTALRSQFPVLTDTAYLNAGTDGPIAAVAADAARTTLALAVDEGRTAAHFERASDLRDAQRSAYAAALACDAADVALTTCTSEGIATAVLGLELSPGDEIVTADDEHPGLYGALQAARDLRGVSIRMVALADVADAVGPRTRLVACSHVSWIDGRMAPVALSEVDVPVLLDGAQGVGAVPVDPAALGCDLYAGSGQKWMCGPDGTGMLYVSPAIRDRVAVTRRGYLSFETPGDGLDAELRDDARRFDAPAIPAEAAAFAGASAGVLAAAGWTPVHERAATLAAAFADALADHGRIVEPRDRSTLVAFSSADPGGEKQRLAEAGVVVRDLPGRTLLRVSVGAWNDESDLQRLLHALD